MPEHVTAAYHPDTRQLTFSWDAEPSEESDWWRDDDIVHIVLLHLPTLDLFRSPGNATRSDGTAIVTINAGWHPADMHCWIYLSSLTLEENSKSLYMVL